MVNLRDEEHARSRVNGLTFRVLVVLGASPPRRWQAEALSVLLKEPGVDVVGVTTAEVSSDSSGVSSSVRAALRLWSVAKRARASSDDLGPRELAPLPGGLPHVAVADARGLEELDAIIDLAPMAPDGVFPRATHGRWSLSIGGRRMDDDELAGVYETTRGRPITELSVQAEDGSSSPGTIVRSIAATLSSPPANRDATLWRATQLPVQAVRRVRCTGQVAESTDMLADPGTVASGEPSLLDLAAFVLRLAWSSCRTLPRLLFYREQFVTAFRQTEHRAFTAVDVSTFDVVASPRGFFYADPFVSEHGGKRVIFCELYNRRKGKAAIGAVTIDGEHVSRPKVVLERDHHLSYPFVFRDREGVFMVPETSAVRQVQMFAAREFPYEWELDAVLLDGIEACDATLFADGSRYWLFTTVPRRGVSPHEELHLYSSAALRGPYEPHPKNPIVADVRTARPAGALFRSDGKLFRPSQDCLLRYGHAIQINEVIALTPTDYHERTVSRIDPKWLPGGIGTHTVNADAGCEVIDNVVRQPRLSPFGVFRPLRDDLGNRVHEP